MAARDVAERPSSPPRASYAELERQRMDLYRRVCLDGDLYAQHELVEVDREIARSRELAGAISQRLAELSPLSGLQYNLDDFVRGTSDMIDELPPSAVRDLYRQKLEDWRAGDRLHEKLAEIHMGLDLAVMDDDRPAFRRLNRSREDLLEEVQRDVDGLTGEGPWLDQVHQRLAEAQREVASLQARREFNVIRPAQIPDDPAAGHGARHRRASRPTPVRRRGSRRGRDDPDPPSDPEHLAAHRRPTERRAVR